MAVALYSGSLTQFFLGTWIEDVPPDDGAPEDEDGADDEGDDEPEAVHAPDDVRAYFDQVRADLTAQLAPLAATPPQWVETVASPRQVAVLEADEYGALMLLAARVAGGPVPYNKKRAWADDPAVRALVLAERDVTTMHHLVKADTWLPGDFAPIVAATLPYAEVHVGSAARLELALAQVEAALAAPPLLPPAETDAARRALAAFKTVLAHARRENLPMVVDA